MALCACAQVEDMKLFGVAIKLAYSSNYDVAKIMDIYKVTSTSTLSLPQLPLPAQLHRR